LSSLVEKIPEESAVNIKQTHTMKNIKNIIIAVLASVTASVALAQQVVQTPDGKLFQMAKDASGNTVLIPLSVVAAPAAPAVAAPAPAPAQPAPVVVAPAAPAPAPAPQQNGLVNGLLNVGNSFVGGGVGNLVEAKIEGRQVSAGKAFLAGGAGNAAKNVAGDALNLFGIGNGGNILNGAKPAGR
jgi:hypothetical protein